MSHMIPTISVRNIFCCNHTEQPELAQHLKTQLQMWKQTLRVKDGVCKRDFCQTRKLTRRGCCEAVKGLEGALEESRNPQ